MALFFIVTATNKLTRSSSSTKWCYINFGTLLKMIPELSESFGRYINASIRDHFGVQLFIGIQRLSIDSRSFICFMKSKERILWEIIGISTSKLFTISLKILFWIGPILRISSRRSHLIVVL